MRTFCTYCGAANMVEARVCYACGTPLPAPSTAAPSPDRAMPPSASWNPPAGQPTADWSWNGQAEAVPPPDPWAYGWQPAPATPTAPTPPPAGPYPPPAQGNASWTAGYPGQLAGAPPWSGTPGYGRQPPVGQSYTGAGRQLTVGQVYSGLPGYPPPTAPVPYATQPGYGYGPGYPPGAYLPVPGYGMMPAVIGPGSLAGVGPRFGAYLLDTIVLAVPLFVLLLLVGVTSSIGLAMLWLLFCVFGPALYFITSWATTGRTVGARAMGLQLVRSDGSQPGVGAAFTRYLGVFLCHLIAFPGLLGVLWMLWDDKKQAWYDKMADTLVVKS